MFERVLVAAAVVVALAAIAPARAEQPERPTTRAWNQESVPDAPARADPTVVAALQRLLSDGPAPAGIVMSEPQTVRGFYADRGSAPQWIAGGKLGTRGRALLSALVAAGQGGDPAMAAIVTAATARSAATDPAKLAELELLLTGGLAQSAVAPDDPLSDGIEAEALAEAAEAEDIAEFLRTWLPDDAGFWRLRTAIGAYEALAANGGWPQVDQGPKLERGVRDGRVAQLRRRLIASGDLVDAGGEPEVFDEALEKAVLAFQTRHGLAADAVVGFQTIDELNVPAEKRVAQLVLNLRRLHEELEDWGEDYVVVNIAAAEMTLVQDGQPSMRANVIVGRKDRPTPEIHSAINRIEFNPFWTVPSRIQRLDIIPKVQKDPQYLARSNIRVYSGWSEEANEIDPSTIDWMSKEAARFRLRQDPGPENALGPAKFLFPNPYDVYLHGTNKQSLFAKPARFLSSGCVRMPDPLGFAARVLKDMPEWTPERIAETVQAGRNKGIRLPEPLPVHLVYRTAWVDDAGVVQFRRDIYGRDAKLARKPVPTTMTSGHGSNR